MSIQKLVISQNRMRIRTYRYAIPLDYYHYNSGLIGISYKNKELLESVLTLSNCALNELNLIVAEELAFPVYFKNMEISTPVINIHFIIYTQNGRDS